MNALAFDAIILGGGCSGLSLALALAKKDPNKSILILESRVEYIPDRTWCFWNIQAHPFENLVDVKWKRWQVRFRGQAHSMRSDHYEYHMLPSARFYDGVMDQIQKNSKITHLSNAIVSKINTDEEWIEIQSSKGIFKSSDVFDSRPEIIPSSLYQHFLGWHVVLDHPVFDPEEIILMDFDVDQSKGLAFMYLLPFSPDEALVESTYISPKIHSSEIYEQDIRDYLSKRFGLENYRICRKERGALPLGIPMNAETSRVIPIGTKAGWMRASTGYAFLPIQEGVDSLLNGNPKSKKLENFLDHVFLSFLKNHPEKAPEVFFNLFQNNDPDRLVRFLTGKASLKETLQVISSMPKTVMIREFLRCHT